MTPSGAAGYASMEPRPCGAALNRQLGSTGCDYLLQGSQTVQHDCGTSLPIVVYTLFAFACLFVFANIWNYSQEFVAIQHGAAPSVADLVAKGDLVRRVTLSLLAAGSLVTLYAVRFRAAASGPCFVVSRTYIILIVLALVSIAWSDDPSLTARRATEFLMVSIASFALARVLTLKSLLILAFWGSLATLALGVIAEISLRTFLPFADDYRFCGTMHPNHQAWNCGMLVLSAWALRTDHRRKSNVVLSAVGVVGFSFLLLTKSRTALTAVVIAFFVLARGRRTRVRHDLLLGTMFLLAGLLLYVALFTPAVISGLYQVGLAGRGHASLETLTGRIPLWRLAWGFVLKRPIAGYGFYSFWDRQHITYFSNHLGWDVPEAHNGYLELLLSLGVIGLILYLALLLRMFARFRFVNRREGTGATAFPVALAAFFLITMVGDTIALNINLVTAIVFAYCWKAPTLVTGQSVYSNGTHGYSNHLPRASMASRERLGHT